MSQPLHSDECKEFSVADDGKYITMVSGFDPEVYPEEKGYFAELIRSFYPYNINYDGGSGGRGFEYLIERDPKTHDLDNDYSARFIRFYAIWMPKPAGFDFDDPDNQLADQIWNQL